VKDDITNKQKDKMKNNLLDVIKTNSKRNVSELNKVVISLINVDAEFKRDMMSLS
jgi:CRISPR/Cas system-associated protein Csm6